MYFIVFQNVPDAILLTSLDDGAIIEANQGFFRLSGYTLGEVVGKTTSELNLWLDWEIREKFMEGLQKQERAQSIEMLFRAKSGEILNTVLFGELIQLDGFLRVLSVIHDITQEKRAQQEIHWLAKLPTENPRPILRIERTGLLLYANPASAPVLAAWGILVGQPVPAFCISMVRDALEGDQLAEF